MNSRESRTLTIEVGTNLETLCRLTPAQQESLRAVFQDSHWRGFRLSHRTSPGGLPDSYVHVLCDDGYEMGIDEDGRVSS
jgi:hypothetical protein